MKPKHYKPQYAVQQSVADILGRFVFPDNDTKGGPPFVAGGGGAPTIVIAASDASDFSKGKADYLCTGVNDHEVIQAALNAIDIGFGLGGRVLLTEGTFHCAYGQIRLADNTAQSPVHLQGLGKATILSFESGAGIAIDMNSEDSTVSDLWIQGNDVNGVAGIAMDDAGQLITGVKIERLGSGDFAIVVGTAATNGIISNNLLEDNLGGGIRAISVDNLVIADNTILDQNGVGIENRLADGLVIANNHISGLDIGIDLINSCDQVVITGNTIGTDGNAIQSEGTLRLVVAGNMLSSASWGVELTSSTSDRVVIADNVFEDCGAGGARSVASFHYKISDNQFFNMGTNPCILVDIAAGTPGGGRTVEVANNTIDECDDVAIHISGYDQTLVANNNITRTNEHGILIEANDCHVIGNVVERTSAATNNTFDDINIDGDRNMVTANKLRAAPGGFAAVRYGVNVAGGDCNMVVGNDLSPPADYGTDALNDAGTNTQLFWPNDATYGDNFTDCPPGT